MEFFNWIHSPEAWIALGIYNIIFIIILVDKLPPKLRQCGRVIGLGVAMVTRIALHLHQVIPQGSKTNAP
jgi:predicted tellurium resistance membrane protein TerC